MLKQFKQQLQCVFAVFALVTAVEVINILSNGALNQFGIWPRHITSLPGVLLGPLLHGSVLHYLSNIVPLCVFSFLLLQYGRAVYIGVSTLLIIGTGLLVWLFGREAMHIGASSLIYGYFGFLVLAGWRRAKWKLLLISIAVAVLYGGLLLGVLPTRYYISWESHLFGLLVGLVLAWWWPLRKSR